MVQIVLVGIAAGIAGALLFLSPIGGTALAFPLFALCGLPIAIAGLGWGALSAAVATIVGGAVIFGVLTGGFAVVYLALIAVPTTWMCRLAGMSRATGPEATDIEWFPIGGILFQGTIAAAIGVIVVGFMVGYDPEVLAEEMSAQLVLWLAQSPDNAALPTADQIEPFVRFNIAAMPFTLSAIIVFVLAFTMWLGARVTDASGRLPRPRLPVWTAALPNQVPIIFAAAVAVSFVAGPVGHMAGAFAGAFGGALALIGLAVVHATTVGNGMRTMILVFVYVVLILFGFPLLLLAVLGLAETFFQFRARPRPGASPNE